MAEGSSDYDFLAKINILGDPDVGKTSIMDRFCENRFYPDPITTLCK